MAQSGTGKDSPQKNRFSGMLIFAIIIFVIAWIFYWNRGITATVKPGSSDTTKSSMIARDTIRLE
jgi:hypothetical protein